MASPLSTVGYVLQVGLSSDADGVMAVMEAAFAKEFGEAWTRSQLLGILLVGGVELYLAVQERDDTVAGFSLSRCVADEAELLLIAVRPDHRRRGLGSQLLHHFLDRSAETGLKRVHLEVRDGNSAIAMYRALGFKPVGRRRNYYRGSHGDSYNAITLARTF
jgi:ribosomal-protein-alanine N-acetyltransferase